MIQSEFKVTLSKKYNIILLSLSAIIELFLILSIFYSDHVLPGNYSTNFRKELHTLDDDEKLPRT
jgi:hypothetical protein